MISSSCSADVEAADQVAEEREPVNDALVGELVPVQRAHHLVHLDHDSPVIGRRDSLGLDPRLDRFELALPVGADLLAPLDVSALPAVGPANIRG